MSAHFEMPEGLRLVVAEEVSPGVMVYLLTDGPLSPGDLHYMARRVLDKAMREEIRTKQEDPKQEPATRTAPPMQAPIVGSPGPSPGAFVSAGVLCLAHYVPRDEHGRCPKCVA